MKPISILITNDLALHTTSDIALIELVIAISNDGESFSITKNRNGNEVGNRLPIALLPKVVANPSGTLTFDWQ